LPRQTWCEYDTFAVLNSSVSLNVLILITAFPFSLQTGGHRRRSSVNVRAVASVEASGSAASKVNLNLQHTDYYDYNSLPPIFKPKLNKLYSFCRLVLAG
jgi:hypothetical protein